MLQTLNIPFFRRFNLFFFLIIGSFSSLVYAQNDIEKSVKISYDKLSKAEKYNERALMLEKILESKNASHDQKFYVYVYQAYAYKSIFEYKPAISILEKALKEALLSANPKESETRANVELFLIYFDMGKYDQSDEIQKKIDAQYLQSLPIEIQGFFLTAMAVKEAKQAHFDKAEKIMNDVVLLYHEKSPRHLPNAYRAKIEIFTFSGKYDQAVAAYNQGIQYAEKYGMDRYIISLTNQIAYTFYMNKEYEKAYFYYEKGENEYRKYNPEQKSDQLNIIENKILTQKKNFEIKKEQQIIRFLGVMSLVIIALIIVVFFLYKINKQTKKLIEKEIFRIKQEIKILLEKPIKPSVTLGFTERQQQIIELVKQNKTNKEIGQSLFISENTVKYHLKIIYEQLNISRRTQIR